MIEVKHITPHLREGKPLKCRAGKRCFIAIGLSARDQYTSLISDQTNIVIVVSDEVMLDSNFANVPEVAFQLAEISNDAMAFKFSTLSGVLRRWQPELSNATVKIILRGPLHNIVKQMRQPLLLFAADQTTQITKEEMLEIEVDFDDLRMSNIIQFNSDSTFQIIKQQ